MKVFILLLVLFLFPLIISEKDRSERQIKISACMKLSKARIAQDSVKNSC